MKSYKDLNLYQRSLVLCEGVYLVSKSWPKEEMYGLTNQIRRASVSIISNLAEGCGRESNKETIYFLSISKGSAFKVESHSAIALRLGYLENESHDELIQLVDEVNRMLIGLINRYKTLNKQTVAWVF